MNEKPSFFFQFQVSPYGRTQDACRNVRSMPVATLIRRIFLMGFARRIALHYIALHYITLHYTTLHYITLHYIPLHSITLHYITLHCIALHCIALHYITLHYITLHYITLHCIALHCIALHCIALHLIDARHGTARHGTARHGTARHGTARHGTAANNGAERNAEQHSVVCDTARSLVHVLATCLKFLLCTVHLAEFRSATLSLVPSCDFVRRQYADRLQHSAADTRVEPKWLALRHEPHLQRTQWPEGRYGYGRYAGYVGRFLSFPSFLFLVSWCWPCCGTHLAWHRLSAAMQAVSRKILTERTENLLSQSAQKGQLFEMS